MADKPSYYEVCVQGQLDDQWAGWFDGWTIAHKEANVTALIGLADQSALHGVLGKVRNLGLVLLSVNRIEQELK